METYLASLFIPYYLDTEETFVLIPSLTLDPAIIIGANAITPIIKIQYIHTVKATGFVLILDEAGRDNSIRYITDLED